MTPTFARSTIDRPLGFLYPDNVGKTDWLDMELGTASGLGDSSVRETAYEGRANGDTAEYRKVGASSWTPIVTVSGMSPNMSFTFDQLMRPMVTYQLGAGTNRVARTAYLYWYDATLSSYQTLSVANAVSPLITFDYPMDASANFAEASWWYLRADNICYRKQSDRFTIEYVFAAKPTNMSILATVGLGRNFRLHVQLEA